MGKFRGVAHVHSTYSFDGRLTLDELAAFFKARGIHFVLMSEHVESLDPEKVCSFVSDCKRCSDASLLLVPGIEIDDFNALFYNTPPVGPWKDCEDLARQLAQGGALVAVSHPVKVRQDISAVTASLVEGVEIWNSRHDGKMALDGRIIDFWLSLRRRLNRPLVPLCGIDFHQEHDFTPLAFEVECEHLDRESVTAAIRAERYQIMLAAKRVPLDFKTGNLPFGHRVYAKLYRLSYLAIYAVHRAALRVDIRPPKRLRSLLRRMF
jgi:hypothetical protein